MGALFTMLFQKVAAVVEWFGKLAVAIFVAAWDLLRDVGCWIFEEVLKVAVSAAGSIDVSGITTSLSAWGDLPSDVLNILALIGVGTAITIITAAIGVRLVLQLIPFTRLGS